MLARALSVLSDKNSTNKDFSCAFFQYSRAKCSWIIVEGLKWKHQSNLHGRYLSVFIADFEQAFGHINPILASFHFIAPENTRKTCFQGLYNNIGQEWVKEGNERWKNGIYHMSSANNSIWMSKFRNRHTNSH